MKVSVFTTNNEGKDEIIIGAVSVKSVEERFWGNYNGAEWDRVSLVVRYNMETNEVVYLEDNCSVDYAILAGEIPAIFIYWKK